QGRVARHRGRLSPRAGDGARECPAGEPPLHRTSEVATVAGPPPSYRVAQQAPPCTGSRPASGQGSHGADRAEAVAKYCPGWADGGAVGKPDPRTEIHRTRPSMARYECGGSRA